MHFHLTAWNPFFPTPHPMVWLLLGPITMVLGAFSLFGLDAVAERVGVERKRRVQLCFIEGALLWPLTILWGHPEDGVALGFAAYAIVAVLDGKWRKASWLMGAGIAFQPLIVLVLPLMIARLGIAKNRSDGEQGGASGDTAACPSSFQGFPRHLEGGRRAADPDVLRARDPLDAIAPHLPSDYVSCGPTRLVATVIACGIGLWTIRHRVDDPMFVWLAGFCLGLRFVAESALEPYYIWPALALLVIAAATRGTSRFSFASAIAILVTCADEGQLRTLVGVVGSGGARPGDRCGYVLRPGSAVREWG